MRITERGLSMPAFRLRRTPPTLSSGQSWSIYGDKKCKHLTDMLLGMILRTCVREKLMNEAYRHTLDCLGMEKAVHLSFYPVEA